DSRAQFHRKPRQDSRRARQNAAIFQIVIGPNSRETEGRQGLPRPFGKADELRKRITVEHVKRVVNTDFAGESLRWDCHRLWLSCVLGPSQRLFPLSAEKKNNVDSSNAIADFVCARSAAI